MLSMIVAPQPLAVEAGAAVLSCGGNAIDAAVTCAFVQSVLSPQMCGIGGYTLLTLHVGNSGHSIALDAPALAGSRVTPEMWEPLVIGPDPSGWGYFLKNRVNTIGYTSICTPGAVRGLATMLERWGTRSWAETIAPAAELAETGFVVDSHLAGRWREPKGMPEETTLLEAIQSNAEASRIYLKPGGQPYDAGDWLRNPDYAATLRELASRGPMDFYEGHLAERMTADLNAHDSFVTAEDFSAYRAREVKPVTSTYRGRRIATSPPPHGGPTLLAALNILEGYDLGALGHNSPEYIYLVSMAMKAAFADRNALLGDPQFVDVPVEWMVSEERAAEWRQRIDSGRPIDVSFTLPDSPDTTHVSVVDGMGNAVALTHSLGMSSGVITPGLGFMYNNSMINFHPLRGHPNSIAPGKGRTTGMTPTIVYEGDQARLVLGAPGATRIITANLQVILNVLDFGMSISDAVLAPRFDCQGELIRCQARVPEYVCAQVRKRHPIERTPYSYGHFGLVHAIHIDPQTGRLSGGADAGAGGMALTV